MPRPQECMGGAGNNDDIVLPGRRDGGNGNEGITSPRNLEREGNNNSDAADGKVGGRKKRPEGKSRGRRCRERNNGPAERGTTAIPPFLAITMVTATIRSPLATWSATGQDGRRGRREGGRPEGHSGRRRCPGCNNEIARGGDDNIVLSGRCGGDDCNNKIEYPRNLEREGNGEGSAVDRKVS